MNLNSKFHKISRKLLLLLFPLFIILNVVSSETFAASSNIGTGYATDDPIGKRLCKVIVILKGNTAKGIAVVAIIVVGVGFFTGKASWPVVLMTVVGIVVIFAAPAIVAMISGDTAANSACVDA